MKENNIENDIEVLKRLLYRNELTQYGKRRLIDYYEQQEKNYKRVLKENEELRTEMNSLKKDISNMYDEEIIISIISDNFNLSRNEVLELLGGEE